MDISMEAMESAHSPLASIERRIRELEWMSTWHYSAFASALRCVIELLAGEDKLRGKNSWPCGE